MPDDVGYEEELAVEGDVVESEDELADFIVDEDEIGHLRKYIFSVLYLSCDLMVVLCHV